MSFRSNKSKYLYLLCALCLVVGVWWLKRPTYQGHGMEWWFDRYIEDYSYIGQFKYLPLTAQQNDAVEAFRNFDKSGVKFLVDNFASGFDDPPYLIPPIQVILESLPSNRNRNLQKEQREQWIRNSQGALEFLVDLGIPYDWANEFGHSAINASTHTNAIFMEVHLLNAVTNQLNHLTERLTENLNHNNGWVAYFSGQGLSRTNLNAKAAIPILLKKSIGKSDYWWCLLYANLAAESPEIRSYLEDSMRSEDFSISFQAALALMNVEINHDPQLRVIESVFKQAAAEKNGYQKHLHSMLTILKFWPHPIDELSPVLRELVKQSKESFPSVVEILQDHNKDITSLLPQLSVLFSEHSVNPFLGDGDVLLAVLLLLQHDIENQGVWSYLDKSVRQLGNSIPIWSYDLALIQLLAPKFDHAQLILNKYPQAKGPVNPNYLACVRRYLQKYGLIQPKNAKTP